jgi:hypothetical protein
VSSELDAALGELRLVTHPVENEHVAAEAETLKAVASADGARLAIALGRLLGAHSNQATTKENRNRPEYFLCTSWMAWSVWGQLHSLIDQSALPRNNVYAPLGLAEERETMSKPVR